MVGSPASWSGPEELEIPVVGRVPTTGIVSRSAQ
jgi:hypothetical protein